MYAALSFFILIGFLLSTELRASPPSLIDLRQCYNDTSCKPTQISKEEYIHFLKERLKKMEVSFDNIESSENYSTLAYFKYMKSSGFYIYYEVMTDSTGRVSKYIFKQNILTDDKYPSKIRNKISKLNGTVFNIQNVQSKFLIDYCYVSDGSEDFMFTLKNGQLIEGSGSLGSINDIGDNDVKKCYRKLINDLYYSLLKYIQ